MPIPGHLRTTAMAVMTHTDAERVPAAARSLDIPCGPRLLITSSCEDMCVPAHSRRPQERHRPTAA